jgi:hypothetical protein
MKRVFPNNLAMSAVDYGISAERDGFKLKQIRRRLHLRSSGSNYPAGGN